MKSFIRYNRVMAIEKRDIDVYEYYHEDFAKLFVDCPDDTEIGDIYEDGVFRKPLKEPDENGGVTE